MSRLGSICAEVGICLARGDISVRSGCGCVEQCPSCVIEVEADASRYD